MLLLPPPSTSSSPGTNKQPSSSFSMPEIQLGFISTYNTCVVVGRSINCHSLSFLFIELVYVYYQSIVVSVPLCACSFWRSAQNVNQVGAQRGKRAMASYTDRYVDVCLSVCLSWRLTFKWTESWGTYVYYHRVCICCSYLDPTFIIHAILIYGLFIVKVLFNYRYYCIVHFDACNIFRRVCSIIICQILLCVLSLA